MGRPSGSSRKREAVSWGSHVGSARGTTLACTAMTGLLTLVTSTPPGRAARTPCRAQHRFPRAADRVAAATTVVRQPAARRISTASLAGCGGGWGRQAARCRRRGAARTRESPSRAAGSRRGPPGWPGRAGRRSPPGPSPGLPRAGRRPAGPASGSTTPARAPRCSASRRASVNSVRCGCAGSSTRAISRPERISRPPMLAAAQIAHSRLSSRRMSRPGSRALGRRPCAIWRGVEQHGDLALPRPLLLAHHQRSGARR